MNLSSDSFISFVIVSLFCCIRIRLIVFIYLNAIIAQDKWTFLTDGKALNVPVSPFITDLPDLVCKNKNIEGGMGIHFFKNAAFGGDWILQEKMVS